MSPPDGTLGDTLIETVNSLHDLFATVRSSGGWGVGVTWEGVATRAARALACPTIFCACRGLGAVARVTLPLEI